VSTRRISDQLGHAKVSMTQDHYLGRRLADRVTADVLEGLFDDGDDETVPNLSLDHSRSGRATC
jgi:hypothetical protein